MATSLVGFHLAWTNPMSQTLHPTVTEEWLTTYKVVERFEDAI